MIGYGGGNLLTRRMLFESMSNNGLLNAMRDYDAIFRRPVFVSPFMILSGMSRMPLGERCGSLDSDALWGSPPTPETDNSDYVKLWENFDEELNIFVQLNRADRLLSIYPYSVMVFYFEKDTDLAEPLQDNAGEVIAIKVFSSDEASVNKCYNTPDSPKHGEPEKYDISGGTNDSTEEVRSNGIVHESRVIHISQSNWVSDFAGIPRLLPCWNILLDIEKLAGSSAETFYNVADRGLAVLLDKDMGAITEADAKALQDSIKNMKDTGGDRTYIGRGGDIKTLGSDAPDPRGAMDVQLKLLAGTIGVPLRQIFGTEAGELSSTQDRAAFARKIALRRRNFAERKIIMQINKLLIMGGVIEAKPEDLSWKWEDPFSPSFIELADAGSKMSRSLANWSNALRPGKNGEPPVQVMTQNEFRHICLGLPPLKTGGDEFIDFNFLQNFQEPENNNLGGGNNVGNR